MYFKEFFVELFYNFKAFLFHNISVKMFHISEANTLFHSYTCLLQDNYGCYKVWCFFCFPSCPRRVFIRPFSTVFKWLHREVWLCVSVCVLKNFNFNFISPKLAVVRDLKWDFAHFSSRGSGLSLYSNKLL